MQTLKGVPEITSATSFDFINAILYLEEISTKKFKGCSFVLKLGVTIMKHTGNLIKTLQYSKLKTMTA